MAADVVMKEKLYTVSADFNKSIEYKLYPPGHSKYPVNAKQLWQDILQVVSLKKKNEPLLSIANTKDPNNVSVVAYYGPEDSKDFHQCVEDIGDFRDYGDGLIPFDRETSGLYDQYKSSGVSQEDDAHPSVIVFTVEFPHSGGRVGLTRDDVQRDGYKKFAVRNSGIIIPYGQFFDRRGDRVGASVDMFNTLLELAHSEWAIYTVDKVYEKPDHNGFIGPLLYVAKRPVNGQPPPRNSGTPLAFSEDGYRFEEHRFTYFYVPFGAPAFEPWDLKTAAAKALVNKVTRQPMKIRGLPRDVQEFAERFSSHERPTRIGNQLDSGMDRKELLSALVHGSPEPGSAEACRQRGALIEHLIGVELVEPITPENIDEVDPEYRIGHSIHKRSPTKIDVIDFDHPISNPLYSYRPGPYVVGPGVRYGRRAHLGRPWYRHLPFLPVPFFPPPVYIAPPPQVYLPESALYGLPPEAVLYDPAVGIPLGWMLLSNGYRAPLGSDITRLKGVSVVKKNEPPKPIKESLAIDQYPPYTEKLSEQARLVADMKAIRAQFNRQSSGNQHIADGMASHESPPYKQKLSEQARLVADMKAIRVQFNRLPNGS